MAKTQTTASKADWRNIDIESLPKGPAKAWTEYKAAYAAAKTAREAFEGLMAKAISVPVGQRAVFGYNFGKLSVAIVPDDGKDRTKKAAAPLTLEAFKASVTSGQRLIKAEAAGSAAMVAT